MSGTEVNPVSFALLALKVDIVLEKIIDHLGHNPLDLMSYRFVCQKWNDAIIHKINKSGISLPISLEHEPDPQHKLTRNVLQSVTNTLTGTKLHFDTVVVGSDLYLADIKYEWEHFLKIQGESIKHFKFKLRPGKWGMNWEFDCVAVVSMENLRVLFSSTPNLESLYICVEFAHHRPDITPSDRDRMFQDGNVPQLQKLTKLTIQEPNGNAYTLEFLKEILSMAPNLTSLYTNPTTEMVTLHRAINSVNKQLPRSLTCLGLSLRDAHHFRNDFSYLRLTKLEINVCNVRRSGNYKFVNTLLQVHHYSLVTVILGNSGNNEDVNDDPGDGDDSMSSMLLSFLSITEFTFPPIMGNLKSFYVDLTQFKLPRVNSYKIQFPVLERLTFSIHGGDEVVKPRDLITSALQPEDGPTLTVKEFNIFCRPMIKERELVSRNANQTFPNAVHYIGDVL